MSEKNNDIALITGASSGLGEAFARVLAGRCKKLILVARREERLKALADELAGQCEVFCLAADLASPLGVASCIETIRQQGPVSILINNAGFGVTGLCHETQAEDQQAMIDLHDSATLSLCRAAIPFMRELGRGDIINVSSVASFLPTPKLAVYSASKAFLNAFSQSLAEEVREHGIRVQVLCPGYTRTEFHVAESFSDFDASRVPEEFWMTAEAVVAESLAALEAGAAPVFIAGEVNRAIAKSALESAAAALA